MILKRIIRQISIFDRNTLWHGNCFIYLMKGIKLLAITLYSIIGLTCMKLAILQLGRDVKIQGYPIIVSEIIATLECTKYKKEFGTKFTLNKTNKYEEVNYE